MNKEIKILYEDNNIIVCVKPAGVRSQRDSSERANMEDLLGGNVFCVHRLDLETSGVMVYAKNKKTAADISKQIQNGKFQKEYIAEIEGIPEEKSGTFEDLLFHDRRKNRSYIVKRERKGVKKAVLDYKIIKIKNNCSIVKIKLHTGRTHQIRVQFASRKMPVVGDRKYGSHDTGGLKLECAKLSFIYKNSLRSFNLEKSKSLLSE